jgi:hypothetical protein
MLYYYSYFKLDLPFYIFALSFYIRGMIKVEKKINDDKYFDRVLPDNPFTTIYLVFF